MTDPRLLVGETLHGGFVIVKVQYADEPMADAIGRDAVARTGIVGRRFDLTIQAGLSESELSVTLYHEVLEAASMAARFVPPAVLDFGEAEFDSAAYKMHEELGEASLETLNRMLKLFGFRGD